MHNSFVRWDFSNFNV